MVKLLIETGSVDVDQKDASGSTPLARACQGGHAAVVNLLINTGYVGLNYKDGSGRDVAIPFCWLG